MDATCQSEGARVADLPTGTVTLLFTDVQGSNQLRQLGVHTDLIDAAFQYHDEVLRASIEQHGGAIFETTGDEFYAAFASALEAVKAALAAQRTLRSPQRGVLTAAIGLALQVRTVLHTGTLALCEGEYTGSALQRTLGLLWLAHGGQILISRATQDLIRDDLPPEVSLKALGLHPLPDVDRPEQLFQLVHPDLPSDFPALHAVPVIPAHLPRGVMIELLFELHRRLEAQQQRRTFLSVDVVLSSAMKRAGSALAAEYSFGQLQRWIKDVVELCGGETQIAAGDGVMCLFPSDTQALRAACELQEGIARFNADQNRLPQPFLIRCGVSAGEIAVDAAEPIGQLQSAIIDRAAALQKRARPGSILVSSEVAAAELIETGLLTPLDEPISGELAFEWGGSGAPRAQS